MREIVGHVREWAIDVRDLSVSNRGEEGNKVLHYQIDPTSKQEECLQIRLPTSKMTQKPRYATGRSSYGAIGRITSISHERLGHSFQ